ncbi:MAG: transcription termination/antitermination protein NusA [Lachnospiraceae bacterium]|nr:transcription termination/antitermination protein NusA [Lachnospiraceae bacterium]
MNIPWRFVLKDFWKKRREQSNEHRIGRGFDILEREKEISRETLFEAIESSLLIACRNNFGKADNIHITMDRETCDYEVYAEKTVVETVEDKSLEISLEDAKKDNPEAEIGDTVKINIDSKEFGRIATQNAKNAILQKIREEERNSVYDRFSGLTRDVVTGIVQRVNGRNISINLGKADAILTESEQVRGEILRPTDRVKVYILDVRNTPKGPRISVSRTHPELVKKLFEAEVAEVRDGTVEIRSISREAGSRIKIAVYSNDPDVDAVGACVGMNGNRVNAVVSELGGEKIDIVNWDDNPALFIENALSPSQVKSVIVDPDEKTAKVVVPDFQLSLAIGKEGQNARLAARLTGYKIDIKSETQAKDAPGFRMEDYLTDEYDDGEYEGEYVEEYTEGGESFESGETAVEENMEETAQDEAAVEEDVEETAQDEATDGEVAEEE